MKGIMENVEDKPVILTEPVTTQSSTQIEKKMKPTNSPMAYAFKNDVLNHIPEIDKAELMPAKWQVLIKLSQEYIISKQTT